MVCANVLFRTGTVRYGHMMRNDLVKKNKRRYTDYWPTRIRSIYMYLLEKKGKRSRFIYTMQNAYPSNHSHLILGRQDNFSSSGFLIHRRGHCRIRITSRLRCSDIFLKFSIFYSCLFLQLQFCLRNIRSLLILGQHGIEVYLECFIYVR